MSITLIIITITVLYSLLCFQNRNLQAKGLLNPFLVYNNHQYHRLLLHALMHGDFFHLFVNMYVFYDFGSTLELFLIQNYGIKGMFYFTLLYISGILFSAYPSIIKHKNNIHYNALGASGAVASILFACIIVFPTSTLYIMFIPFAIPAFLFGVIYLFYEAYMHKNVQSNIAHDAHFYGAVWGILFTLMLNISLLNDFILKVKLYLLG